MNIFFNESPGRFIITIDEKNEDNLLSHFGANCTFLGTVTSKKSMQIQDTGLVIMDVPFDRIRESWKKNFMKPKVLVLCGDGINCERENSPKLFPWLVLILLYFILMSF